MNCSPDSIFCLLPKLLQSKKIEKLSIKYSPLPQNCLQAMLSVHCSWNSVLHLYISCSIDDKGFIYMCRNHLQSNTSITQLWLDNNPHITSESSDALCDLLLHNSTLSLLSLVGTSLTSDGLSRILYVLTHEDTKLETLILDSEHIKLCRCFEFNCPTCKILFE